MGFRNFFFFFPETLNIDRAHNFVHKLISKLLWTFKFLIKIVFIKKKKSFYIQLTKQITKLLILFTNTLCTYNDYFINVLVKNTSSAKLYYFGLRLTVLVFVSHSLQSIRNTLSIGDELHVGSRYEFESNHWHLHRPIRRETQQSPGKLYQWFVLELSRVERRLDGQTRFTQRLRRMAVYWWHTTGDERQ